MMHDIVRSASVASGCTRSLTHALAILAISIFSLTALAGTYQSGSPASTNNDDTCDVAYLPAATLLMPYFEVDLDKPASTATSSIFTVVNTSQVPQIINVTIWSDRGYLAGRFTHFLTGYDVVSLSLFDILVREVLPVTSSATEPRGSRSLADNPVVNESGECGPSVATIASNMRSVLSIGRTTSGSSGVGNVHPNVAIGFVTIDVVGNCAAGSPLDATYYTSDVRFDNVLTGDYQIVRPGSPTGYSTGGPMVAIRALPEGGTPATRVGPAFTVNMGATFYDRFSTFHQDARQPLPATFAARVYDGGSYQLSTKLTLWLNGITSGSTTASGYAVNGKLPVTEIVRFDDHENATIFSLAGDTNADGNYSWSDVIDLAKALFAAPPAAHPYVVTAGSADANYDGAVTIADVFYLANYELRQGPYPGGCAGAPCRVNPVLPMTSRVDVRDATVFPPKFTGTADVGGWIYLNLSGSSTARQSWVTVQQSLGGFDSQYDAIMLGNGCSPRVGVTSVNTPIGPAANVNP